MQRWRDRKKLESKKEKEKKEKEKAQAAAALQHQQQQQQQQQVMGSWGGEARRNGVTTNTHPALDRGRWNSAGSSSTEGLSKKAAQRKKKRESSSRRNGGGGGAFRHRRLVGRRHKQAGNGRRRRRSGVNPRQPTRCCFRTRSSLGDCRLKRRLRDEWHERGRAGFIRRNIGAAAAARGGQV